MKSMKLMMTIGAVVLVLTLATSAFAQSHRFDFSIPTSNSVNGVVSVYIPFSFNVAGVTLPPGDYLIGQPNEKGVMVKSEIGARGVIGLTIPVAKLETIASPKLVFHKYGNRYFLAQTWLRCSDTGREFQLTEQEMTIARTHKQEQVIILAAK